MHLQSPHVKALAILWLCSVAVTATGCATLTQAEIKALETREMDCSYDDAYKACLLYTSPSPRDS